MNSAESIRRTRVLIKKQCIRSKDKHYFGRVDEFNGKKIKNAWNIGNHQSVVIHSNGGVFSTCLPGL